MKTEPEIGMIHVQPKDTRDFQPTSEARREEWSRLFLRAHGGNKSQHLDFRFLVSTTVKEYMSMILSHSVYGTWLQQF